VGGTFSILHQNCHLHFTYVTPFAPKIDSSSTIIHDHVHAEDVLVVYGELSSNLQDRQLCKKSVNY
jgi:hypothetical protein